MPLDSLPPAAILVVDDEPAISRVVTRYLSHLGYTVLEAESGEQALAMVRERWPPIDLVLSDSRIQGSNGTDLATLVLAECPGPSVVLMSSRLSGRTERANVRGRIVSVIRKPIDLDQLSDLLRAMLEYYLPTEEWESVQVIACQPFAWCRRSRVFG